ncbi:MAG: hypothetical protein J6Y47_08335 [Bacteroidales bacterium]|nr:hypothetical protein [Bacteroidales bacterium]
MKTRFFKILIISIILFIVRDAYSQWYLGGGVSAWYNGNYRELQVGCSPEFGYGFNEHWSVGGSVKFNYRYRTFNDPISGEEWHSQNWYVLANPYFRYAFFTKNNWSLFMDVELGLGYSTAGFMISTGIRPGVSYTFNEHFRLVGHFGWLGIEKQGVSTLNGGLRFNDGKMGLSFFYVF